MRKIISILILGCLVHFSGFSQENYLYKRKIEVKQDSLKWHSIEIPDDMYDKVKSNLSDIRIFSFTVNDTIEVPYLLTQTPHYSIPKTAQSKLINQSKTNEGYYFTFEKMNNKVDVNDIQLLFSNQNFDWKVNLQASHNQNEWFTILEDYRILSIKNTQTDYRFETLVFDKTNYKYYRVFIKTQDLPELNTFFLNYSLETFYKLKQQKITKFSVTNDDKNKTTVIEFFIENRLPVHSILFDVENEFDFYRTIKIDYLTDSIKTEKGWVKNYNHFSYGTLSSLEKVEFSKTTNHPFLAKGFRVVVENFDNQPLKFESVEVTSYIDEVTFKTEPNKDYYLFYGNKNANEPVYDIKAFRNKIFEEENIQKATLLKEIKITKQEIAQTKPLFESKFWLWGIMILIIGILGFFSLKMLSKKV